MRAPLPVALALGGTAVFAACQHRGQDPTNTTSTTVATTRPNRPKVALHVPNDATIPSGPEGDLVRKGRLYAMRTFEELPDLVGADLHCTSCHLDAGMRANAGPWVGLAKVFPEYRARAGHVVALEERIDECFQRSMNGKAPGKGSPVMDAFVAYIEWLSREVPHGAEVVGRGFARIDRPPIIDPDNGRVVYSVRCASCHGKDGQGRRADDGSYQFPPLWGDRTFNIGAGMARVDTAAAFVRHNMPLGQGESLTLLDAYDVSAYFTERDRADCVKKQGDWPHGGKPLDARY